MILGPLLTRFGKAFVPKPGGDKIGRRRIDTHLVGFQKMGAHFEFISQINAYRLSTHRLQGVIYYLMRLQLPGQLI